MKTFRTIVKEAIESLGGSVDHFDSDELALAIDHGLKLEGIHLHEAERCVRPGGPRPSEMGRPMTPAEMAATGWR